MLENKIDLQYLLDQAAIHQLHLRYFRAIDHGDKEKVRACFTGDVISTYHGRKSTKGVDALVDQIDPTFNYLKNKESTVVYHFMGNMNILRLEGDIAETETYAISCPRFEGEGDGIGLRGLRYLDRLRRDGGEWRICERQKVNDWEAHGSKAFWTTVAQRINALPNR